ncbi:MAG: hypothetical protein CV087_17535 [Candidatus Brocadia sp. WS118]|nr:MAG: hypothetical protein CV087_17535 [Candidatus Brocadia sp. WS118]
MWTPNSIIRHKHTGIELLVVHVYRNCTIVVSLSETEPLVTPRALLERDYHYFARDTDMKNTDEVNYEGSWKYSPVKM